MLLLLLLLLPVALAPLVMYRESLVASISDRFRKELQHKKMIGSNQYCSLTDQEEEARGIRQTTTPTTTRRTRTFLFKCPQLLTVSAKGTEGRREP